MPKISDVSNHPIRCIVALGTSTCCQLRNFLPSKRKGLLQHTVDIEVSALARLALYENSLIRQEISVCCPQYRVSVLKGLNLEKM